MNLMKHYWLYLVFSLSLLVIGGWSLLTQGLRPSIDFTGGSLLEVEAPLPSDLDQGKIQQMVGDSMEVTSVQKSGTQQVILRGKEIDNATKDVVIQKLQTELGTVKELRFETVGPILGKELLQKTFVAIVIVSSIITLYVWRQFNELKYGVSAILAMLHDSLMLLGVFSILGYVRGVEVDVLFVTALLTTLSFSVHDTIVVFDRIRELSRKNSTMPFTTIVNAAVLQTLNRSLNNSLTIIIMLLALALLGGNTIRWFTVALLVGAITGTYSSTFVAAPLLLLSNQLKKYVSLAKTV